MTPETFIKRGSLYVIFTQVLFINDDEKCAISFVDRGDHIRMLLAFEPRNDFLRNPPIRVEEETSDDPQCIYSNSQVKPLPIRVEGAPSIAKLTFVGWNRPLVYAALKPIELGIVGNRKLYFSACNTYLDGTNRLDIQFYASEMNHV